MRWHYISYSDQNYKKRKGHVLTVKKYLVGVRKGLESGTMKMKFGVATRNVPQRNHIQV